MSSAGETALDIAALFGNEALMKKLIAASCKVDLLKENGQTALHYAVKNGYVAIAEQLIVARCHQRFHLRDCAPHHHWYWGTGKLAEN
jgi:ankyrin repeat protein